LDKLSAISGLQIDVSIEDLQRIVGQVGCAIVSANADIAPADRRLYGLRDITATVPSIDLITASILSKKLAAGLEALVLDVKCGTGAFMQTPQEAVQLAQSLVDTAQSAGCKTTALVTDMNQPLARAAGNSLEMMEVMEALCSPKLDSDLIRLTISLGGEVLVHAGLAVDAAAGEMALTNALTQGHAAEVFGRMVAAQGGATDFVARWRDRLPAAPYAVDIFPQKTGYIRAIDARTLGEVVVHLGGGRLQAEDQIDKRVGLSDIQRIGDLADPTTPLLRLHARDPEIAKHMGAIVLDAFTLSEETPPRPALIHERIG
jgi:thymidine phosphorylase